MIIVKDNVLKFHRVIHWVMSHSRLLNSLGEEGLWLEHKDPSRPEKTPKLHPEVILLHILGKSEESPISLALDGKLDWTQTVKTLGTVELEQGLQEFEVFCFIFKKRGLLKSFKLEVEDIKSFMNEVEVISWKRTLNHLLKCMEDDLFVEYAENMFLLEPRAGAWNSSAVRPLDFELRSSLYIWCYNKLFQKSEA